MTTSTISAAPKRRLVDRLPIVKQLRQSVGLQRGMLVAGLIITVGFILTAVFAPLLAPYGYSQLRDDAGADKTHLDGGVPGAVGSRPVRISALGR